MPKAGVETFDYIVVGSGADGGTVAARLAEGGMSVLILEAGADPAALAFEGPARGL
jgi:choline dehydrogenase